LPVKNADLPLRVKDTQISKKAARRQP